MRALISVLLLYTTALCCLVLRAEDSDVAVTVDVSGAPDSSIGGSAEEAGDEPGEFTDGEVSDYEDDGYETDEDADEADDFEGMSEEEKRQILTDEFQEFDLNKDGHINREELEAQFEEGEVTPETLSSLIAEADKNNDGKISKEEYYAFEEL